MLPWHRRSIWALSLLLVFGLSGWADNPSEERLRRDITFLASDQCEGRETESQQPDVDLLIRKKLHARVFQCNRARSHADEKHQQRSYEVFGKKHAMACTTRALPSRVPSPPAGGQEPQGERARRSGGAQQTTGAGDPTAAHQQPQRDRGVQRIPGDAMGEGRTIRPGQVEERP